MKNHLNVIFALALSLSLAAAMFVTGASANAEDGSSSTPFESLDYFEIMEGHGIRYHVTDDHYDPNCNIWAVSQYVETNKPSELDFVFTLVKEGTAGGYFRNSSIGGQISRSVDGKLLTFFYAGYPVGNQANFYCQFSLPRFFNSGDEWAVGDKSYRVEHVGAQTAGGIEFADCIRVDIDDSQNASEYLRGTGYYILAKGIGIVKLVFTRTTGENVLFEYLGHEQLAKHTISGTIVDCEVPVEGIIVQISNANWGIRSVTDSTGNFSIEAYGPDILLYIGYDQDNNDVLDFDYYPDWPKEYCVNNITSDILGLSIVVQGTIPLGSTSGRVIDNLTGQAVSGARIEVSDYQTGLGHRAATTDGDGYYTVSGLPTSQYRVQVRAEGYATEWYQDTYNINEATPVSVTAPGNTPDINFSLELGGTISGHIYEADGVTPISNVRLNAWDATSNIWMAGTRTSTDGSYILEGLPTGSYFVRAEPSQSGLKHMDEYYDGVYNREDATPVSVTAPGDTPNIDFSLELGGTISGRVIDSTTLEPVSGTWISVYDYQTGHHYGWATTDADGYYTISGLPTGEYRVQVRADGYIDGWYQDTTNYGLATPVPVTAPGDTPNIDFSLEVGGSISGQVIDSTTGQPISDAWVYASDYHTGLGYGGASTNDQGYYTINDLPVGEYRVQAEASGHAREWYQDTYDPSEATIVSVAAQSDTPGIDFALELGGSISGQATDGATGLPISGAYVNVSDYGTGYLLRSQRTRAAGTYTVDGLPTGVDRVEIFDTPGYIHEYYQNAYNRDQATPVSVTAPGGDTPNIDFSLELGGTISGHVYEADGVTPISNVVVLAWDATSNVWMAGNRTGTDGSYILKGLPTGSYLVQVRAEGYISEWYQDTYNINEATPVSVTQPNDTPNIDFLLSRLYETPAGQNVVISDPYTGVTTEFTEVSDSGMTSVNVSENNPGDDTTDFRFLDKYYDINTDASYTGTIKVTITYDESEIPAGTAEEDLCLLHWDGIEWVPVDPQSLDTANNTITGWVDSLSWFAIGKPNEPPMAEATVTPYLGPVESEFAFDADTSYDPDGTIVSHEWDFGDEASGSGVSVTHTYDAPGLYDVTLTVTDDTGAQSTDTFIAVVYDLEGGFVTGGGWIDSPAGAYTVEPELMGRATFGFVSKYGKGADTPSGETEFRFRVADLNFHSTSYQWLVIAGARAQYKGTGTINGEGEYGFMLTAIDGQVNGGGCVDKFRIKIWYKVTGEVIYDNKLGEADSSGMATELGGGSIVIHTQ